MALTFRGAHFQFWNFDLRIAIAIQNYGAELHREGDRQPHLPMRKDTGLDEEAARESQIGAQTPHPQGESNKCSRGQ